MLTLSINPNEVDTNKLAMANDNNKPVRKATLLYDDADALGIYYNNIVFDFQGLSLCVTSGL